MLLCLINSFFGTFEKTQLQIEHFLEHLAKWHCCSIFPAGLKYEIKSASNESVVSITKKLLLCTTPSFEALTVFVPAEEEDEPDWEGLI